MKKLLLSFLILSSITGLAQPIEYNYICPVPDSRYINPEQTIILKTGYPYNPLSLHEAFVTMKGSESGLFLATMSLSSDLKTLFIHHNKKFALGETIHIFVSGGLETLEGKAIRSIFFEFVIRENHLLPLLNNYYQHQEQETPETKPFRSSQAGKYAGRDNNLPADYPAPTSVYTTSGVADGYTFVTPSVRMTPQYSDYLTIWDNHGIPIYYQKKDYTVFDFKVLDDGMLTFAKGANQSAALKRYYLMDTKYQITDSVLAGNGYYIDNHDMQLMDNGHYLIIIYDPQVVNMSLIVEGGQPDAIVTGLVIQEVDNQQNVYFQWRSWDHFEITDCTDDINLLAHQIDYVHANALDIDTDGHILLSSRHLDEITKININTGNIIWRFGLNAKNNQFTVLNDPIGFSHQHDIRITDNGTYTLFDNGNLHIPQLSRAMEYQIDEQGMVANLLYDYIHTPAIYAPSTGSTRRLPNNNTLIGWGGSTPIALTEVNQNDQVVFEVELPNNVAGYRVLKYPWNTTLFSSQENINFGNFVDNSDPKEYLLQITNNHSQTIQINSAHIHHPENFFIENLPMTIQPGASIQLSVFFQPGKDGTYEDILTLNYDNYGNTRRIARQVHLHGLKDPELPSLQFDPENGSVEVDPYAEIVITFSEPVRKVFGQALQDSDVPNLFLLKTSNLFGSNVPFHGTVSEDKTIITLFPDEALAGNQQHYVQLVPNKLADYQNNVIDYSDYSFFTTGDPVGFPDISGSDNILLYPNPSKEYLVIRSGDQRIHRIDIISGDGRTVLSRSCDDERVRISTAELPSGLLLLRITTADGRQISRQVIHHN